MISNALLTGPILGRCYRILHPAPPDELAARFAVAQPAPGPVRAEEADFVREDDPESRDLDEDRSGAWRWESKVFRGVIRHQIRHVPGSAARQQAVRLAAGRFHVPLERLRGAVQRDLIGEGRALLVPKTLPTTTLVTLLVREDRCLVAGRRDIAPVLLTRLQKALGPVETLPMFGASGPGPAASRLLLLSALAQRGPALDAGVDITAAKVGCPGLRLQARDLIADLMARSQLAAMLEDPNSGPELETWSVRVGLPGGVRVLLDIDTQGVYHFVTPPLRGGLPHERIAVRWSQAQRAADRFSATLFKLRQETAP